MNTSKTKRVFEVILKTFFHISQVLSVRHANQTRKNIADTTFKLKQKLLWVGVKHEESLRNIFCLSITLIWNFEVHFPETIQIFQIPKIGII